VCVCGTIIKRENVVISKEETALGRRSEEQHHRCDANEILIMMTSTITKRARANNSRV
jgi:hypothetical protein